MGWSAVAWAPTGGQPPSPHGTTGSKHARQCYDSLRQRVVITGGDRDSSDAGQPNIYSFVPGSGAFTLLRSTTATGKQPAYPDNCTWVYASQVDRHVIAKAFWFGHDYAVSQQPARPDADWLLNNGIFNPNDNTYSSTVVPTPPTLGWGGDSNCNFGTYDPVTNSLVRFFWDGAWGMDIQFIPLGDLSSFPTATHVNCGSGHPSGSFIRNYIRNVDPHARQIALDVQGRAAYVIAQSSTTLLPPGDTGWGLVKIDLNDPTKGERIPLPPTFDPQEVGEAGGGTDNYLCFDSIRRQIQHPQVNGYSGEVKSAIIYDLASQTWQTITSTGPPYPQGNTFCFAPSVGAGVLTGGRATTSVLRPGEPMPVPTHYFMLTPGVEPPVPQLVTVRSTALTRPLNVDAATLAGFYRFTVHNPGNPTPLQTVNTPNASIRFGDFTNLTLGAAYDFKGVLRTQGDTGDIGGTITKTVTVTGEDPNPPDPPPGDATPPTISITFPAVDEHVSGLMTPVFTATDASGILRVEVRVNGALLAPSTAFDTTTVPNGDTTLQIDAWDNSVAQNQATQTRNFVVDNPAPPDPPDPEPTTDRPQSIFMYPMPTDPDRVIYVLWAEVPVGFEFIFQRKGSAWPLATAAEVADVEAGRIAEKVDSMLREGTDADMQAALLVKFTSWQTKVTSVETWALANAFNDGTAWHTRG